MHSGGDPLQSQNECPMLPMLFFLMLFFCNRIKLGPGSHVWFCQRLHSLTLIKLVFPPPCRLNLKKKLETCHVDSWYLALHSIPQPCWHHLLSTGCCKRPAPLHQLPRVSSMPENYQHLYARTWLILVDCTDVQSMNLWFYTVILSKTVLELIRSCFVENTKRMNIVLSHTNSIRQLSNSLVIGRDWSSALTHASVVQLM